MQINQSGIMTTTDKEKNLKNTFCPFLPFFPGTNSFPSLLSPSPEQYREVGKGDHGWFIMLIPCHSFLCTLFPCSSIRSPSWETVPHKFVQCVSFPQVASGTAPMQVSLPQGQSFRNRLLQHTSLGEPQILARRPAPS